MGGIGECGENQFPAIYIRVGHPEIWDFIQSIIKGTDAIQVSGECFQSSLPCVRVNKMHSMLVKIPFLAFNGISRQALGLGLLL